MASFQGRRVSNQWRIVLTAAQRAGVRFSVSSGQRTFAQQQGAVIALLVEAVNGLGARLVALEPN